MPPTCPLRCATKWRGARDVSKYHKLTAEPVYHNPDPLIWPLGCANEAVIVIEGVEMIALVDAGSQISTITERFCTEMGLRILPLGIC